MSDFEARCRQLDIESDPARHFEQLVYRTDCLVASAERCAAKGKPRGVAVWLSHANATLNVAYRRLENLASRPMEAATLAALTQRIEALT